MTPRPPGVLISTLLQSEEEEVNIVDNFCRIIKELYTHPKDEINKFLIKIKDRDILLIRNTLFVKCTQELSQKFLELEIYISEEEPISNLRKRYKADKCYDDIFILAISLIEGKSHKDLLKLINSSSPPNNINNTSTNSGQPIFTAAESAIIAELHNIRNGMKEVRKENKELKEKLNLACTKIDKYESLIEQLNAKVSELTVHKSEACTVHVPETWSSILGNTERRKELVLPSDADLRPALVNNDKSKQTNISALSASSSTLTSLTTPTYNL